MGGLFLKECKMTASPISHTAQEKKERIETAVMLTKNGRPCSLQERMVDYTIPGVSIAVINRLPPGVGLWLWRSEKG